MADPTLFKRLAPLVQGGDVEPVRALLRQDASVLDEDNNGSFFLRLAAQNNDVAMASLLVEEFGVDLNVPEDDEDDENPEGPIGEATANGSVEVVRWMLDRGAILNHRVDGTLRCFALADAVIEEQLEIVKILVEAGAAINATWNGQNALSLAVTQGHTEIEEYLRSTGAIEPGPDEATPPEEPSPLMEYMASHHGELRPTVIQQILPVGPQVSIRVAESSDRIVLFTDGMADHPLQLPQVAADPVHIELMIALPAGWKLGSDALQDPRALWPIALLRRIASDPMQHIEMAERAGLVFSTGSSSTPLAPDSTMSFAMARPEGQVPHADGGTISLYRVLPMYPEERDACRSLGVRSPLGSRSPLDR